MTWGADLIADALLKSMSLSEWTFPSGCYATLHAGNYPLNEHGQLDESADVPELARIWVEPGQKILLFKDLPECDAKHVALWTKNNTLLLRAYCFPVEELPEVYQSRHIPKGGSVEVTQL